MTWGAVWHVSSMVSRESTYRACWCSCSCTWWQISQSGLECLAKACGHSNSLSLYENPRTGEPLVASLETHLIEFFVASFSTTAALARFVSLVVIDPGDGMYKPVVPCTGSRGRMLCMRHCCGRPSNRLASPVLALFGSMSVLLSVV